MRGVMEHPYGMAVYVRDEHDTVSPAPMVNPPVRLMSEPEAATAQCTMTVPAPVSMVAVATGEALPVALVSLVIEFAVIVPLDDAPNAGLPNDSVATAVPGAPAVPVRRNTNFAVVLSVESTRSATVSRNAVG